MLQAGDHSEKIEGRLKDSSQHTDSERLFVEVQRCVPFPPMVGQHGDRYALSPVPPTKGASDLQRAPVLDSLDQDGICNGKILKADARAIEKGDLGFVLPSWLLAGDDSAQRGDCLG